MNKGITSTLSSVFFVGSVVLDGVVTCVVGYNRGVLTVVGNGRQFPSAGGEVVSGG